MIDYKKRADEAMAFLDTFESILCMRLLRVNGAIATLEEEKEKLEDAMEAYERQATRWEDEDDDQP